MQIFILIIVIVNRFNKEGQEPFHNSFFFFVQINNNKSFNLTTMLWATLQNYNDENKQGT